MRLTLGIMYLIIGLFIVVCIYKKKHDYFHPIIIYQLLCILRYVPHLIYSNYDFGIFINQSDCAKVFFYTLIGNLFTLIGYIFYETRHKKKDTSSQSEFPESIDEKSNYIEKQKDLKLLIGIVSIFGFSSIFGLQRIIASGGIATILNNAASAYADLSTGGGLSAYLFSSSMFGVALAFYCYSKKKKKVFIIVAIIFICIYSLMNIIYSSRAPVANAIVLGMFLFHIYIKKINLRMLTRPKFLLIILIVVMIIQIGPIMRKKPFSDITINDFFKSSETSQSSFLDQFSSVGRDAATYRYFNSSNYWLGSTYLRLFTSIIPSEIYANKPPVDDGIYLTHILAGGITNGTEGRNNLLSKYSIPFSTNGIMYANFGMIGIILGNFFVGFIYGKLYRSLLKTKEPFKIIIYFYFIWSFALTVSSLFSLIISCCIYKSYDVIFNLYLRIKWK